MYVKELPNIDETKRRIDSFKWQFVARLYVYFGGGDKGFIKAYKFVTGDTPSAALRNTIYSNLGFIITVRDTILEMEGKTLQDAANKAGLTLTFLMKTLKTLIKEKPNAVNLRLGFEWLNTAYEEANEKGLNGGSLFGSNRNAIGNIDLEDAVEVGDVSSQPGNGKQKVNKQETVGVSPN